MIGRRTEIAYGILMMMIAPGAIAVTTIEDVYFMAGEVQPIIGEKMRNGQWRPAQSKLSVGMERIANSKSKGLNAYSVIVDASQLDGKVPKQCVRRLSMAWTELAKTFEGIEGTSTKRPQSESDERGGEWQRLSWDQDGCKVTLLQDYPANFGPQDAEHMMTLFPGLRFDRGVPLKRGRVTLAGGGQATQIEFLALQRELPVRLRN